MRGQGRWHQRWCVTGWRLGHDVVKRRSYLEAPEALLVLVPLFSTLGALECSVAGERIMLRARTADGQTLPHVASSLDGHLRPFGASRAVSASLSETSAGQP